MLSTKPENGNIPMKASPFTGGFKFNNTHMANLYLLKPYEWGPYKQIGNLTAEGLQFVYDTLPANEDPPLWEDR